MEEEVQWWTAVVAEHLLCVATMAYGLQQEVAVVEHLASHFLLFFVDGNGCVFHLLLQLRLQER